MEAFIYVRMTFQPWSRNLRPMRSDDNIASPAERLANGVVQSVNVVLAVTGCVAMGVLVGTHTDPLQHGTYTPFIVISFGGMQRRRLLGLIWAVAPVGELVKADRTAPLRAPAPLSGHGLGSAVPTRITAEPAGVGDHLLVAGGLFYSALASCSTWRECASRKRSGTVSSSLPPTCHYAAIGYLGGLKINLSVARWTAVGSGPEQSQLLGQPSRRPGC